jgi:hypothetical protein
MPTTNGITVFMHFLSLNQHKFGFSNTEINMIVCSVVRYEKI